ncbi:GNAT family N-acetyltransferase [Aminipila butyrica]|uniref:GNAT family N-acetyltransferase n=1 Tax=Aminipila butyrica TaxID=433296 RepID=A0A858BX69_9FIRM|nr:GNAT family N-acetyltransferase [Aminipila butyrica]QIB69685.1 GNAT family N-acetyltransferase [Aminipila butyrica]
MIIKEITQPSDDIINNLFDLWACSVRATHLFLSENDLQQISEYIPNALLQVPHLIVIQNTDGKFLGFMGIADTKLEMLFISPEARGRGAGKQLVTYGIENYSVNEVCVNEQNPQAVGFYRHLGFVVYKRTERDEQGNPFPLLFMNYSYTRKVCL